MMRFTVTNVGGHHPLRAKREQKVRGKRSSLFFFVSWMFIFYCPCTLELLVLRPSDSETDTSSPLVLKHLTLDWSYSMGSPDSWAFRLGLNYITSCPAL